MPGEPVVTLGRELAVDDSCLDAVHGLLAELWAAVTIGDTDRYAFTTAVAEIAANVVEHAPDDRRHAWIDLAAYEDRVVAVMRDDGPPMSSHDLLDEMPGSDAESGRGLALARAAADVGYARTRAGNEWRIVRRLA